MSYQDNKRLVAGGTLASKGRKGDDKIRKVKGKASHVNSYEAYLIDSYGKSGEELTEKFGSGTTNPKTGMPEYYSGGAGKVGQLAGGVGSLLTGGAAATTGAFLAPLAVGLMAYDWIAGAGKKAKQAKKQMAKLSEGIGEIEKARLKATEFVTEDIQNVWEGVGSQLSDIRYGAGETMEELAGGVDQVIKAQKGLATGAGEKLVSDTQANLTDQYTKGQDSLVDQAGNAINDIGRAHESNLEDMEFQIKDMKDQIATLSESDSWLENLW